jgi:hypothetical protein
MQNRAASFDVDLSTGQAGEEMLLQMWPQLERLSGLQFDFLTPDGEGLELKTERRSLAQTKNIFIERWSDVSAQRVGGPWQAWGRGATLFCVLYAPDQVALLYRTAELIGWVEQHLSTLQSVRVRNRTWYTEGLLVPRSLVEHLLVKGTPLSQTKLPIVLTQS